MTNSCNRIKTLADLNSPPSSSYTHEQHRIINEDDPSKQKPDINSLFKKVREMGASDGYFESQSNSSLMPFSGVGQSLSGETVTNSSTQMENIVHTIIFWTDGFTVNGGPLQSYDDPNNTEFLKSIKMSECPKELEPSDNNAVVHVNLVHRKENFQLKAKQSTKFQGVGRVLGSSGSPDAVPSISSESKISDDPNSCVFDSISDIQSSIGLLADKSKPSTFLQIYLCDGTRLVPCLNFSQTVGDIRAFINAAKPDLTTSYKLQVRDFPPRLLNNPNQTIEGAGLINSVIIQKS